jgi:hypothetical protein
MPTVKAIPPEMAEEAVRKVSAGATPNEIRDWLASHGIQVAQTTARKIVRDARKTAPPPYAAPTDPVSAARAALPDASLTRDALRVLLSLARDSDVPGTARVNAARAVLDHETGEAIRLLQVELAEISRK